MESAKQYYDADYIIRKQNEYEEQRIYNSPAEVALRKMIEEATIKCNLQNEKCKLQKAKLESKRLERLKRQGLAPASESEEQLGM